MAKIPLTVRVSPEYRGTAQRIGAGMRSHEIFELGDFAIGGTTLPDARPAFRTYGELNADNSNAILFPTWFAGTHEANEWLIGEGKALDTARYFVIASAATATPTSPASRSSRSGRTPDR
ncbi:homoserine acetyltransferase [Nocardia sp. GAS34]|uniref:hypothetical protein n=1 Tax=unclassified Nocardia TaxID=2637762 RepID=UPI003D1A4731